MKKLHTTKMVLLSVLLIVVLITGSIFMVGCALFEKSTVIAKFSVTENVSGSSLSQATKNFSASSLLANQRFSFTPSSLVIRLKGIYLASEMVYSATAGGLTCPAGQPQINVTGDPTPVDLIGASAFSSLLSFTVNVGRSLFGDYRGILLLYGDDDPVGGGYPECNVLVSGTVNVGGTDYTITDLPVPMGTTGIGLNMPQTVTIDHKNTAVVNVIFDVEKCAYLMFNPTTPQSAILPDHIGTDNLGVVIDNLVFAPYVGSDNPTVRKFKVVVNTTDFGDNTKWYLKLVTYCDNVGNLVAAGWQTVYLDGYTSTGNWEPGMLYAQVITKTGSTYEIKEDDSISFTPAERRLKFLDFDFASTTGNLNYGGTDYTYTATEY